MYNFVKLGQFLLEQRHTFGYTQAFVEEKTGICEKTLQNIEYAKTETGVEFICLLFALYNISVEMIGNFFILDEQEECDRILIDFLRERNLAAQEELIAAGK